MSWWWWQGWWYSGRAGGERDRGVCFGLRAFFFARAFLTVFVFAGNGCLPLLVCTTYLFVFCLYVCRHSVRKCSLKRFFYVSGPPVFLFFFFSSCLFFPLLAMTMKREKVERELAVARYRVSYVQPMPGAYVPRDRLAHLGAAGGKGLGVSRLFQPSSGLCFPRGVLLRCTCLPREIRQGCWGERGDGGGIPLFYLP